MVIDAAKGIEARTRKLFEVCRLRDVPITTFINKMDREGRDPFELLDEIAHDLQLEVTPASGERLWPAPGVRMGAFIVAYVQARPSDSSAQTKPS